MSNRVSAIPVRDIPSDSQKDALKGTSGTPSNVNRYVTQLALQAVKTFTNVQNPSWTHNLGFYPMAKMVDSAGNEIDTWITHNSVNQFTANTPYALTGEFYIVPGAVA